MLVAVVVIDVVLVSVVDVVVLVPSLTIIITVGVVVIETVIPDRDGIKLISSISRALISDKVICISASMLLAAAARASTCPIDAGK